MAKGDHRVVHGGGFYGITETGRMVPVGQDEPGFRAPDLWICRRVADFRSGQIPEGAAFAPCTRCAAHLVYNPKRTVDAPKVCLQCAHIDPLPIR
ncbi:MAG: hypothetical protein EHM24_19690 [Acidobacteria bacterium]|nr:MAG: hypothetical protein EHM24_19690 [Acidobacteriota bacterium]